MTRYRIKPCLAKRMLVEAWPITLDQMPWETGNNRRALSGITHQHGYFASTRIQQSATRASPAQSATWLSTPRT